MDNDLGEKRKVVTRPLALGYALSVAVALSACSTPRTEVRVDIHDDSVTLEPTTGPEEVMLTVTNRGARPCPLVVFITDDVNGPVDPDALPTKDGVVDFETTDFHEIEAAEGVEQGGPPLEPGQRVVLSLGFQGTPTVTRIVLCNDVDDYDRGRYAVYRSNGM